MNNITNKEDTKLTNKEKLLFAGGCVFVTGLLAVGYMTGSKFAQMRLSRGIEKCWEADPTLKEHMWSVIDKLNQK